jgi:hypothetical protein
MNHYEVRYEAISDTFREDGKYLRYLQELRSLEKDLISALRRSNYEDSQLEVIIETVNARIDAIELLYDQNNR